jgi:hypothetical protein
MKSEYAGGNLYPIRYSTMIRRLCEAVAGTDPGLASRMVTTNRLFYRKFSATVREQIPLEQFVLSRVRTEQTEALSPVKSVALPNRSSFAGFAMPLLLKKSGISRTTGNI